MGLFGTDPGKIVERATRLQGVLTGIQYGYTSGDTPQRIENFAIRLGNGATVGVRQHLDPNDRTRLGMAVDVWELKGEAVIDWASTCSRLGVSGTVDR